MQRKRKSIALLPVNTFIYESLNANELSMAIICNLLFVICGFVLHHFVCGAVCD